MTEKPCPFCGGEAKAFSGKCEDLGGYYYFKIRCSKCDANIERVVRPEFAYYLLNELKKLEEQVTQMWNRRTP